MTAATTELAIALAILVIAGIVGWACYVIGESRGRDAGTKHGLEVAWSRLDTATSETLDRLDRRGRQTPQPLAIQYAIRTGGDSSSTPLNGRLILPELTRAEWTDPATHEEIRERLAKAYPGCEIIGYAVLDRTPDPTFEVIEGGGS